MVNNSTFFDRLHCMKDGQTDEQQHHSALYMLSGAKNVADTSQKLHITPRSQCRLSASESS